MARVGCESNPCAKDVKCVDTSDGFRCGPCPKGYEGNGTHCKDVNEVNISNIGPLKFINGLVDFPFFLIFHYYFDDINMRI